jgi:TRAP-type C4-dicarboxylate transport system substrate-binding protein
VYFRGWNCCFVGLLAYLCATFHTGLGLAHAEQVVKLAYTFSGRSPYADLLRKFADQVTQNASSAVKVVPRRVPDYGPEFRTLDKLRSGEFDILMTENPFGSEIEALKILELPFLIRNRLHMSRVIDSVLTPMFAQWARESDVEILGILDGGFRHIGAKRLVTGISSLAGLRIGMPSVGPKGEMRDPTQELLKELGAFPLIVPVDRIDEAAEGDYIEGVDASIATMIEFRLYETLPYVTFTHHVAVPIYIVIRADRISPLDPYVRGAVEVAARHLQITSFSGPEDLERRMVGQMRPVRRVIDLSASERKKFEVKSRVFYDRFSFLHGGSSELVSQILRLDPGRGGL